MIAALYSPPAATMPAALLERVARDFSPRIEILTPALVLIDIDGLDRLIGEPRLVGEELQRACRPFAPHVALASTGTAGQLLAREVAGLTLVPPGHEAAMVAPLRVEALSGLGAPPDLLSTLERWGLQTLGAFAALPPAELASRLGPAGVVWQRVARGEDARPLVPKLPEERFEEMLDLEWPIEGIDPLAFVLGRLLDPLCARLEQRDRAVAAIVLRLRVAVTRTWQMRRLELPAPMRDPRLLRTLLCLDLEGHPDVLRAADGTLGGIDRIGIGIEPTPGRIAQFSLLAPPTVAPEAITTLMARLRALMGHDRCGSAALVDTHRPGAFVMEDFQPDGARRSGGARPFLFGQPGPSKAQALRRLRHPIPARVSLEHGRPVRVVTDRRGWSGGQVCWCAGPWRSSGDWWNGPFDYQEWDVTLSDEASYRIHEDRADSHWYIAAILD